MKKITNFRRALEVLNRADFARVHEDELYRMGVVAQFNLTFELAWKALQEMLKVHNVAGAEQGSPREILKLAHSVGFLEDAEIWLVMLKKRNAVIHIYDEDQVDELIVMILDSFIRVFYNLLSVLMKKEQELEQEL